MKMTKKVVCGLFVAFMCFGAVGEEILLHYEDYVEQIEVADDATYFSLAEGSEVMAIEGLEKIETLEHIELSGTEKLEDYSFIGKCTNLKVLVLNNVKVEGFEFLNNLEGLKVLAMDHVVAQRLPELKKLSALEYFAYTNGKLKDFSLVAKHSKNLRYVNLSNNKIEELDNPKSSDKTLYFLANNPLVFAKSKNISFAKDITSLLPEEFHEFVK